MTAAPEANERTRVIVSSLLPLEKAVSRDPKHAFVAEGAGRFPWEINVALFYEIECGRGVIGCLIAVGTLNAPQIAGFCSRRLST